MGGKGMMSWSPSADRAVCGSVFFFQAEDGIRDYKVTGVQTCALPILADYSGLDRRWTRAHGAHAGAGVAVGERGHESMVYPDLSNQPAIGVPAFVIAP